MEHLIGLGENQFVADVLVMELSSNIVGVEADRVRRMLSVWSYKGKISLAALLTLLEPSLA